MKQGRNWIPTCALIACVAGAAWMGVVADTPVAQAAPAKAAAKAEASKSKSARQFSGWVTALDKTSLTVEKRGKLAKTVVFSRHAEMKTTGDLEKDARVTVFYRDEDGQPTAHRVVVKPAKGGSTAGRAAGSGTATRSGR